MGKRFSKTVVGNRVREAREFNELNQATLATLVGVKRQSISAIEKNIQNPSHETIIKLSNVLNFPLEFFFDESFDDLTRTSVLTFRSTSRRRKKQKLRASHYDEWLNRIESYLSTFIDFPTFDFSIFNDYDYIDLENEDIEVISKKLRHDLGLGIGPISNMTNLLESVGVFLGVVDLPDSIDAFSSSYGHYNNILMRYPKNKSVRIRMNQAHELGHLVLHRNLDEDEYIENYKLIEKQAMLFAGSFLLPRETFVSEFFSSDFNSLLRMKKRWKVAIQAIIVRARQLEIISQEQYTRLFKRLSSRGFRKSEPLDDEIAVDRPMLINRAMHLLVSNGVVSKQQLLGDIGIPEPIIVQISNLEKDFFAVDNIIKLKLVDKFISERRREA